MLAERRQVASEGKELDPVREAARTLGQRGAAARQERQAATAQAQEPAEQEAQSVENTPEGTPGDLTETQTDATDRAAGDQGESAPQIIDFGDGVSMPITEVKDSILRQADYTRKTTELAEKRKALDARETQKLASLDQAIGAFAQEIGDPNKPLSAWLTEDPIDGLQKFAAHQDKVAKLHAGLELKRRHETQRLVEMEGERDTILAETYNKEWADPVKRDAAYTQLTAYALKLGAKPEQLPHLIDPWMIKVLDKAARLDAIEAGRGQITKAVNAKPPVIRPGAKVSAGAARQSDAQSAQARLKSSGSIADAVKLLQASRAARG